MDRPSAELLAKVYPQTDLRKQLSTYETLLSIDKAREVLGFEPQHSWRDEVKPA
jgi:nucleoside-diphosphate-sugar epimerase